MVRLIVGQGKRCCKSGEVMLCIGYMILLLLVGPTNYEREECISNARYIFLQKWVFAICLKEKIDQIQNT